MTTITKERIEQYAHDKRMCNVNDEIRKMARMLLAGMEQEPVYQVFDESGGWFDIEKNDVGEETDCGNQVRTLYAAPQPAPAGMQQEPVAWRYRTTDINGNPNPRWSFSEEASLLGLYQPLYAAPQPLTDSERAELQEYRKADEREKIRVAHAEWSRETFGSVGPVGPLKHLAKEALEAAAEPGDLSEWAYMQFLLWDAQRGAGITDEQITQAMFEKLGVNKSRQWPEPKDGQPRLHIKTQSK